MGNLILFYSRKGENYVAGSIRYLPQGNTEIAAKYIQNAVGGTLFELETVEPYAASYDQCIQEAKAQLQQHARPALKQYLDSLEGFDTIFLCGPCWWGTFPCGVFSQLERLDFAGKRIFPLMTHEGSGLGHCERDLEALCPGAIFGKALAVPGSQVTSTQPVVAKWAQESVSSH